MTDQTDGAAIAEVPADDVWLQQWADQLGLGTKAVLTTKEAADVLRVSERSMRDMLKAGTVPSVRLGRRLVVPVPMLLRSLLEEPKHD